MTEIVWALCTDARPMLNSLLESKPASARKLRLFAVACCRRLDGLLLPAQMGDVTVAERFADGVADATELAEARANLPDWGAETAAEEAAFLVLADDIRQVVVDVAIGVATAHAAAVELTLAIQNPGAKAYFGTPEDAARRELGFAADSLRCVFGNPFRPVAFAPEWRTETAVALARGIYAERAWDRLPVLADALDDAGCDHPDVLAHLRGPGPHARGCWVVDEVLGLV